MKTILLGVLALAPMLFFAQNNFKAKIYNAATDEVLIGATCKIKNTNLGAASNLEGIIEIKDVPNGEYDLVFSFIGFESSTIHYTFPIIQNGEESKLNLIPLLPSEEALDEIVIEATRSNRSISDSPTRTEALTDEIDEAAGMEPSKISHLITHSTGIQVQTTSAASNGAVVRIQGLNGRYTQMLKDGFPLYGGFSGSLDILQIPPLDLRQVEFVKGPASTLYGGGAIAGLVNLLSKKANKDETLLHLNWSHIGARDFNAFVSRDMGKFGFTNLASMHLHNAYDSDGDEFSDVPEIAKFNFNPKLFYYPDNQTEIYLGATISKETRNAGDMNLISGQELSIEDFYYDKQSSSRITSQFSANREMSESSSITIKNSLSWFNRDIQINPSFYNPKINFSGQQFNSYSEVSYQLNKENHLLTIGANFIQDEFVEHQIDSLMNPRNQFYETYGGFANHVWDIGKKISLESGLRVDIAKGNSRSTVSNEDPFILPRISGLWKVSDDFAIRAGGGMGYRMPTIFNEEAEPFGYYNLRAIDFGNTLAERSSGANVDFKYSSDFGSPKMVFTLNQMFFYNQIDNPIRLLSDSTETLYFSNYGDAVISQGFETQMKWTIGKFTWFVGYTYTDAFFANDGENAELVLTPRHSIKGDLLFVEDNKWRIGWDYEYKSGQLLSSNIRTPDLITTGVIVERTIDNFVIFLNAENFTDVRQTKYESILSGPNETPQFTEMWAPVDGFFFNLGLKIKL